MVRRVAHHLFFLCLILTGIGSILVYIVWGDALLSQVLFHVQDSMARGEELRSDILAYGVLAPVFFCVVQIMQVLLAPIPGEASGILGGYLFGAWLGFIYSSFGLTLGSILAFVIGRLIGEFMPAKIYQTKAYDKFNHLVARGDFVVPFILFIFPGFPKDSLSYLLGFSRMPLPVFIVVAGVGRMPGTLMLSFQGAEVQLGNYWNLLLLLVISAAVTVPCYVFRKKLLSHLRHYNKKGRLSEISDGSDE